VSTIRWNIAVSPEMDREVRMFIAAQGGGSKGDLSRFVEAAVTSYLFDRSVSEANAAAAGLSDAELANLIDEAVSWAREH
jgi:hypothetical protein